MSGRLLLLTLSFALAAERAGAADPTSVAVPYRLTDSKHVLVRTKLNGRGPYNFILDTGAPAVFIPKKIAAEVGLKLDDKGWGEFERFQVEGGLSIDKVKTRVEDLFQLEGMNSMGIAGVELHGVIGYNVLAKYRITYDFSADKLTWVPLTFDPPGLKAIGGGRGGQGGLEMLGPIMKMMAGLLGMSANFETQQRGFLGITIDDKKDGVFVASTLANSPAAESLKSGDRLVAIGIAKKGSKKKPSMIDIDQERDLSRALATAQPGDQVHLEYKRADKSMTAIITLAKGL